MVRGKIQLKRIENANSRQVTFSKRKNGLLKKAHELSVLCDSEVALIIFSQKGKIYEFSSYNIQKTIERYLEHTKEERNVTTDVGKLQHLKHEVTFLAKKIEMLENCQRKLLGHNLENLSIDELQEIDGKLEKGLKNIRARKSCLFNEEIENLRAKEKILTDENTMLSKNLGINRRHPSDEERGSGSLSRRTMTSEVVTDLSIALPITTFPGTK